LNLIKQIYREENNLGILTPPKYLTEGLRCY